MGTGYLPRSDSKAAQWMRNFANRLVQFHDVYHLSAEEAQEVAVAVAGFRSALAVSSDPKTRTAGAIAHKDTARKQAAKVCGIYYPRLKSDPTIPDSEKVQLGVRPIKKTRSRINAPDTRPCLSGPVVALGEHLIAFHDIAGCNRRAKPAGATQLQLFRYFEDSPGRTPELIGCYTRTPIRLRYGGKDNGRIAVYAARWMTRRGEVGPWSYPASAPVIVLVPLFNTAQAA